MSVDGNIKGPPVPKLFSQMKLLSNVETKPLKWLWFPYMPGGAITLLAGKPSVGKGLVASSLAASITKGSVFPDGTTAPKGTVLWFETEDPLEEVLRPRLLAAGADPNMIVATSFVGEPVIPPLSSIKDYIRAWTGPEAKSPLKLIVLSPIKAFMPGLTNANDELAVRKEMAELNGLITGTDCAILGLIHLNKKADLDVLDRIGGSGAFAQVVRGVVGVEKESGEENWRRFANIKYSHGPEGQQFLYRPENTGDSEKDQSVRAEWKVADDHKDTQTLFSSPQQNGPEDGSAREWLERYFEENGPTLAVEVVNAWVARGEKAKTVEAAFYRWKAKGVFESTGNDGFQGKATWSLACQPQMPPLRGAGRVGTWELGSERPGAGHVTT